MVAMAHVHSEPTSEKKLQDAILGNEQLYDLFISKVARESAEIIEAHSSRVRNRTTVFVTIGLALLAAVAALALEELRASIKIDARTTAENLVDRELENLFSSQSFQTRTGSLIEMRVANIDKRIDFLQDQISFLNVVQKFERDDTGFTEAQASALINGLAAAKQSTTNILNITELLESIVPKFASADRFDLISTLNDSVSEEMQSSPIICQAIVLSVGISITGFEVSPQKATGRFKSEWENYIDLYRPYAESCRTHKYPEVPYVFDLILAMMEEEDEDVTRAIALETTNMTDHELARVSVILSDLLTGDWARPGASQRAVQRAKARAREMVELYGQHDTSQTLLSTLYLHITEN